MKPMSPELEDAFKHLQAAFLEIQGVAESVVADVSGEDDGIQLSLSFREGSRRLTLAWKVKKVAFGFELLNVDDVLSGTEE